jgi:hypothetical protein
MGSEHQGAPTPFCFEDPSQSTDDAKRHAPPGRPTPSPPLLCQNERKRAHFVEQSERQGSDARGDGQTGERARMSDQAIRRNCSECGARMSGTRCDSCGASRLATRQRRRVQAEESRGGTLINEQPVIAIILGAAICAGFVYALMTGFIDRLGRRQVYLFVAGPALVLYGSLSFARQRRVRLRNAEKRRRRTRER